MTTYNGPIIRPSLMPLGAVHHSRNKSSRNKSRDRRRSKEEEATFQTGMCQSRKRKIKVLKPGGRLGGYSGDGVSHFPLRKEYNINVFYSLMQF